MTPFRVGLTGGIAAGKSTVARWLRDAGFEVIDADRLVAALYLPGNDGAHAVARLFGPLVLLHDGGVDHQKLAAKIFSDPAALKQLEVAIHPLVKREFAAIVERVGGVVVLEAPLLVEAGFAADFDLVVTIEASPEARMKRATDRGLDPDEARRRLAAQTDEATRTAVAHRVLRNNGSLAELRPQVVELIEEIEAMVATGV